MATPIRARELTPGMVLGEGPRSGQVVRSAEPADGCWLRVTVTAPTGGTDRFQMAPGAPVAIRA